VLVIVFTLICAPSCALLYFFRQKNVTPEKKAMPKSAAPAFIADDVEAEVDGGIGGEGEAYGSEAVGCAASADLKGDERLAPADVIVFTMDPCKVDAMARENSCKPEAAQTLALAATEAKTVDPPDDITTLERAASLISGSGAVLWGSMTSAIGSATGVCTGSDALETTKTIDNATDGEKGLEGEEGLEPTSTGDARSKVAKESKPDQAADAFVKALRAGLGLDLALTPREGRSVSFNVVEMELRTLFQRCDTDGSNTMGRAEYTRALRILNLDKHLEISNQPSARVMMLLKKQTPFH